MAGAEAEMERKYRSMKHAARIVKVTTKYAW